MNEFQRFEKLIIEAFKIHSNYFDFNLPAKVATSDDVDANQLVLDYQIEGLMDLKHDDQIVEEIGNWIKHEISVGFSELFKENKKTNTLEVTESYNKAMILAGKNALDLNSMTKIKCGTSVVYVVPYLQQVKDVVNQKITKTFFRFATIIVAK